MHSFSISSVTLIYAKSVVLELDFYFSISQEDTSIGLYMLGVFIGA